MVDWYDLLISFCFNLKLIKIINLFIWFTPQKIRCICGFLALKSQVNITLLVHTWKDFFCSCKIGINSNVKAVFFSWAAIQELLKPVQILSIFTNRYLSCRFQSVFLSCTDSASHTSKILIPNTQKRNNKNYKCLLRNKFIKCSWIWEDINSWSKLVLLLLFKL